MAGGVGSRFWPMSKVAKPKQFLDVLGIGSSLIQMTYHRFVTICPKQNIFVVTSQMYKDLVSEQLPEIPQENILCEPMRRNTAVCICYANMKIMQINPNANVIVAPSDHLILNENSFLSIVNLALLNSKTHDILITLGIRPSYPNTGYGYIQFDKVIGLEDNAQIKKVKIFTEKPSRDIAEKFIESGDFLWNAGIFIWSARAIDKALLTYLPDIYNSFAKGKKIFGTGKEEEFLQETYSSSNAISIDYGVMEKATNVYVIPSDFGWSDVGTWKALYEVLPKDENNNAVKGKNIMLYNSKDNIISISNENLAVIEGLEDSIVVSNGNILLICKKDQEQRIKQFLTDVEVKKSTEYL